MSRLALYTAILGIALMASDPVAGASDTAPVDAGPTTEAALGERMNANTVTVVTGTPGGTYFRVGAELSFVLDDGDKLRILPILGKGAGENAYDIRFLKGVDLGFVRTDTLDQLRQDKRLKNIEQQIQYIAKLFNDELHIIAPKSVRSVSDLAGSGSASTSRAAVPTIAAGPCSANSASLWTVSTSISPLPSRCCATGKSRRSCRWQPSRWLSSRTSIRANASIS